MTAIVLNKNQYHLIFITPAPSYFYHKPFNICNNETKFLRYFRLTRFPVFNSSSRRNKTSRHFRQPHGATAANRCSYLGESKENKTVKVKTS